MSEFVATLRSLRINRVPTEVCPVCRRGGQSIRELFTEAGLTLFRCGGCKLIFQPRTESTASDSDDNPDLVYEDPHYHSKTRETESAKRRMFARRLRELDVGGTDTVVDVGCGIGEFLAEAEARGAAVTGFEISQTSALEASGRVGGKIVNDEFRADALDQTATVLHLHHVLEHVRDPLGLLCETRNAIAPGGLLAVEVPNESLYYLRVLAYSIASPSAESRATPIPPHLNYFTKKSLARAVEASGYRVEKVRTVSYGDPDRREAYGPGWGQSLKARTFSRFLQLRLDQVFGLTGYLQLIARAA